MEPADSCEGSPSSTPRTQLHDIATPHHNDVLFGRGVTCNRWKGNEQFRNIVAQNKELYLSIGKREKMTVSRAIVKQVRAMNPPGRFLERDPETGTYFDVGEKKAIEKASQALRDGSTSVKKDVTASAGKDARDSSSLIVERVSRSPASAEKGQFGAEADKPKKSKGMKRATRRTLSGMANPVRRKTLNNKKRIGRVEQPVEPPMIEVTSGDDLQLTPIVSPQKSASDYPKWHQLTQQRSNSFGGFSTNEPSVVTLPSESQVPAYNDSYGPNWTHRRVSYPYHQAHCVPLHTQDMEGPPVWSSPDDGLGRAPFPPPVSPSSGHCHSIWRASQYEHGHTYPPDIPSLRAWSSDSGMYNRDFRPTHGHPIQPPSWRPGPHYGHESLGVPPLMASNRLNLPHPLLDDSPAPFVIRRSGGGNRFAGIRELPRATPLDFTPPPSPSRKKREGHGAAAEGKTSSPHFTEKSRPSTSPLPKMEISSTRPAGSPSEITEENEGSVFLKEHVPQTNAEAMVCDVVSSSDDWISRSSEPVAVCIGDASGSEAETKLEDASLSPLPFHDGDYAYADGSLIMDLTEELLGLPMDSV